uniref:Uncharacterized protein n=1 Tax=Octopus bimaculoides TaxID=37653 RepID=A0A0L8FJI8_OCTBM
MNISTLNPLAQSKVNNWFGWFPKSFHFKHSQYQEMKQALLNCKILKTSRTGQAIFTNISSACLKLYIKVEKYIYI